MVKRRIKTSVGPQVPVNDIGQCVQQAKDLDIHDPLRRVFSSLAGDEITGLIAYAIWRGRSHLISNLQSASDYMQSEANASRASQAKSYWKKDTVASGDLPRQRRLGW